MSLIERICNCYNQKVVVIKFIEMNYKFFFGEILTAIHYDTGSP